VINVNTIIGLPLYAFFSIFCVRVSRFIMRYYSIVTTLPMI